MPYDFLTSWAFLLLATSSGFAGGPCFTVECPFDGPPCAFGIESGPAVRKISDIGFICGYTTTCAEAEHRAFVWSHSTGLDVIPMLPQFDNAEANAVNDAGVTVGWMSVGFGAFHGFIYVQSQVVHVPPPPPANSLTLRSVNNDNVIVGDYQNSTTGDPPLTAFRWIAGVIEPLILPLTGNSTAVDVSETGLITGTMGGYFTVASARAYSWQSGHVTQLDPLPGWTNSLGEAINNRGDVVGSCRTLPFDPRLGYLPKRATMWVDGKPIDLGVLPGGWQSSVATDINDSRQIIGYCTDHKDGSGSTYFFWQDGVMYDLEALVQLPDDIVTFGGVTGINNLNQLASGGVSIYSDMGGVGFILNPASPADLSGDCIVNGIDLAELLGDWGRCPRNRACPADLDANGVINGFDLAMLLAAWG